MAIPSAHDSILQRSMTASWLAGFTVGLALIVAIGAQNAFVLRQGLRGQHVVAVVATCVISDVVLIVAGVAGLGAVILAHPMALLTARWGGAAFLLCYAALAARRALRPGVLTPTDRPAAALGPTLAMCLGFTYLNPHVYLDTVVLLGTIANQHSQRWWFAVGAGCASATWFTALGAGARRFSRLLATPVAWRCLDGFIALVMCVVAGLLLLG
jgi:L-lysine exporter family protein LysE/ArgO